MIFPKSILFSQTLLPVWNLTIPQRICIFCSYRIAINYCIYFITFSRICQYPAHNCRYFLHVLRASTTYSTVAKSFFFSVRSLANRAISELCTPKSYIFSIVFSSSIFVFLYFGALVIRFLPPARAKQYRTSRQRSHCIQA